MKRLKREWCGVALLAVGWWAVAAGMGGRQESAAEGGPSTNLDGPTLFKARGCAQCHMIAGVGGHKGPDLSGVGRQLKRDAIERQIRVGGGEMPAFGDVLPNEEVERLVDYLRHQREKRQREDGEKVRAAQR